MSSKLLSAIISTVLVVTTVITVGAEPKIADRITFQPQRQAIKIVPGLDGSDMGDFAGRGAVMVAHLQDLGVSLTRVGIAWADTEPAKGRYDWTIPDEMINFLANRGIEPLVVLFSAPRWARTSHPTDAERDKELGDVIYADLDMPRDDLAEDYASWAEAVTRRYRGRVRFYEFWNEPDGIPGPVLLRGKPGELIAGKTGGDPVRYARFLKVVHAGLKRGNPDAKLAAGSLSVYGTDFLQAIYATIGRGHFEAVSLHPYSGDGVHTRWIEDLRKVCVRYGDPGCELWLTEYDWTPIEKRPEKKTTYGQGEAAETLLSDGVTLAAHYPYVTQLYLHTLNDWSASASPLPWEGFGLLNIELKPKPKYEEYRKALLWRRLTQARELMLCGPHVVFPKRPFDIYVEPTAAKNVGEVEWFIPEGWKVEDLGNSRFRFTAPPGAAAPTPYALTARNGRGTTFTRYVEVVEPAQIAQTVARRGAQEGAPAIVESLLFNLGPEPLDAAISFSYPSGYRSEKQSVTIAPGKPTRVTSLIAFNPGARLGTYPTEAILSMDGREVGRYGFDLVLEAVAVRGTRRVDGDLEDWKDTEWVQVSGKASPARFALAWDERMLYIACIVEDEKHVQTRDPKYLWKEDSIQIGIDSLLDAVPGSSLTSDDSEWQFALADEKPANWRRHAPEGLYGGEIDGVSLAIERGTDVTVYEVGIPWAQLAPLEPKTDAVFGFELVVNDSDGHGRLVSMWTHGIADGKRPARFGRVRLRNG